MDVVVKLKLKAIQKINCKHKIKLSNKIRRGLKIMMMKNVPIRKIPQETRPILAQRFVVEVEVVEEEDVEAVLLLLIIFGNVDKTATKIIKIRRKGMVHELPSEVNG